MIEKKQKKYLSLRILFFRWLILFSVIPLAIIAFLFSYEFKSAVQVEIFERLLIYTKQIQDLFSEYEAYSQSRLNAASEDKTLLYQMKTENLMPLRSSLIKYLDQDLASSFVVYNQYGDAILRVASKKQAEKGTSKMSETTKLALENADQHTFAFYYSLGDRAYLNLSVIKRLRDNSLNWQGYLEKIIVFDENTLKQIKDNFGLDVIFFGPKGEVFLTSLPEQRFTREQLSKDFLRGNNHYFDVDVNGKSFGFISTAVVWGNQKFLIAIGAAKTSLTKSVNRFRYILTSAFILLVFGIILFSFRFTNQIIQPLSKLVLAMRQMSEKGEPIEVQHFSRTEVGLLADNFNEMSRQISEYQTDLEKKIEDLEKANVEVRDTQNQLIQSAKLAGLGQLVAGVAHELNNPIGFIYSNIQHLREYSNSLITLTQELGKEHKDFDKLKEKYDFEFISKDLPKLISSCEEGARRTREIVVGLRNFSRASDKEEKRFSVTDCLDSTLDLLKGAAKKGSVSTEKRYDEFVPLITGNPNQISQVFMNILSNAFQAVEDKGQVGIDVTYNKKEEEITVVISDNGAGIEQENLGKIFDPFFTTKEVGKGTGLGLSISYGIIQSHGGDIRVQSEVGKGTQFIVTLPTEPPNSQANT